jgi:hypothetical protein
VDESATGSLNFFWQRGAPVPFLVSFAAMHLRMPSIDQGVQAFAWAVFFFLLLWLGMIAVGVSGATAFILSLIAGAGIFAFVRVRGEDRPGERVGP